MKTCFLGRAGFWARVVLSFLAVMATQRGEGMSLTVDAAVLHALQHNPNLKATRAAIAEAQGNRETVGRLAAPELFGEIAPEASTSGNGRISMGVTQRFPLTGRRRIQKAMSDRLVDQAVAEVREAERLLAGEVRARCVELLAARQQLGVHARQLTNLQAQLDWATRNARVAEGSALDVAQLEFEYRQLASQRVVFEGAELERQGMLSALLGLPVGARCELEGELRLPDSMEGNDLGTTAIERSDYQLAQARVAVAERRVELARASRWEDASMGVFAEHERQEDAPLGRVKDDFIGLRFSVPLPLRRRAVDAGPQARAAWERRVLESTAVTMQIQSERVLLRQQMVLAARQARSLADDLLPAALRLEERLLAARASGQGAFADVLRARERRLRLEMNLVEMIRDYHLAQARWRTATETSVSKLP